MKLRACSREKEVSALVLRGQWPEACAAELREHVAGCRACGDLVLVMQAFQSARGTAADAAAPGPAGVLWWRAQLRRRNEAVEKISKPIVGAQVFALSVTVAIAAIFAISQARQWLRLLEWFRQVGQSRTFHLADLWSSAVAMPQWALPLLVCGVAAVALFGGAVVYFDRQRQ